MGLNRTHEDRATLEGITQGAREAPQGCTLGYPVYRLSRDTSVITLVPGSALVFSEHGAEQMTVSAMLYKWGNQGPNPLEA